MGLPVDLKEEENASPSHIHGKNKGDIPSFQDLEEDHFLNNPLCEPHHLVGSLKEGEEKLRVCKEIFVDENALVSRCC